MHPEHLPTTEWPASSAINDAVIALRSHREKLAATPATDEQLKQIWPPWNALPDDMLPGEKRRILTLDEESEHHRNSSQFAPFKKLQKQFKYLPFDRHEYNQALNQAYWWATLSDFIQSTRKYHKDLVERQWTFADADNQATGRVAISRAVLEINITHPGLLESKSPTLKNIKILKHHYVAYFKARKRALTALAKLVFIPELRTGKRLPIDQVALGVPRPPKDVPRYLYIARLDALAVCSPKRLNDFIREDLPNLSRPQRMKFDKIRRKPKFGKNPYAGFLVWVLENRPIFENAQFGWQWKDILKAAEERNIECPKTGLKEWAYRSTVHLKVKLGQPHGDEREIKRSSSLLSPAPIFGESLQTATV